MQLAPAARLDLAVDARVAVLHEQARVRARLGEAGELQQLAEADRLLADRDVAWIVVAGHASTQPHRAPRRTGGTERTAWPAGRRGACEACPMAERQRLPGVQLVAPSRLRPRLHYELLACAIAGHELIGIDARRLSDDDALLAREIGGVRWHRCLRCDSWLPVGAPAEPARDVPPAREEIVLPLRGKPLRDKIVLRLIAINRLVHCVVLGAIAAAIFVFAAHREALRGRFYEILTDLQLGTGGSKVPKHGVLHEIERAFSTGSGTLRLVGAVFVAYALVEGVEAFGLWYQHRWAEYLTFLVTASLLPLEAYELAHKLSALKVITIVINLAVVVYLLWAKRLFGLRGGAEADEREKAADVGWPALERSAPEVVGAAAT